MFPAVWMDENDICRIFSSADEGDIRLNSSWRYGSYESAEIGLWKGTRKEGIGQKDEAVFYL